MVVWAGNVQGDAERAQANRVPDLAKESINGAV